MKRASTPSFVVELPVTVTGDTARQLDARLLAGTRLYNTTLGEALTRLTLMRESDAWSQAKTIKDDKTKWKTYADIKQHYGFTSAAVSSYATQCKNAAGWKSRLSANETQRIAETAFQAAEQHSYGKRGKPRFKNQDKPLKSFSGKTNKAGIRYQQELGVVEWHGLIMKVKYPPTGKDAWIEEALTNPTKFCRLVWRMVKGQKRWFVQLVQEGLSPKKPGKKTQSGKEVGLDIGPSTIAIVAENAAALLPFCPTIEQPWDTIAKLQKKMDRSRRQTNPQCYNKDGTWKQGSKIKVRSKRYTQIREQIANIERKLQAERKRAHCELANKIIAQGNIIKTETLSYKAWQKLYGRSVKVKAPATFISILKRKAESAGGEVQELNTRLLKMSQYDHISDSYSKKPLNQRWHILGGKLPENAQHATLVQRDLYSAFLAWCVVDGRHSSYQLSCRWSGVKQRLVQSGGCRDTEVTNGGACALPAVSFSPTESIG